MKIGDIKTMMGQIAPVIREFTEATVKPVLDRMAAIEKTVAEFRVPRDGNDVDPKEVERLVSEKVAAIPVPKDGADGVGFDDLDVVHDGSRGFVFRFVKGDRVKEFAFSLPVVLDKGVYREGQEYEAGDGVTFGGSFWIAQQKTTGKPDSGADWRLAVKRGRDGKSLPPAPAGVAGPVSVGVPAKGARHG